MREIGGVGRFPAVTPCRIYIRRMDHPITEERGGEGEGDDDGRIGITWRGSRHLFFSPSLSVGISVVVARVRSARQQVVGSLLQGFPVKARDLRDKADLMFAVSRPCVGGLVRWTRAWSAALKLISTGKRAHNAKGSNLALEGGEGGRPPLMQFRPPSPSLSSAIPPFPRLLPCSILTPLSLSTLHYPTTIYRPCQWRPAGKEREGDTGKGMAWRAVAR